MYKKLIEPLQMWLLLQGRCVGCSMPLVKGTKSKAKGQDLVTCKCRRVFVLEKDGRYRRALQSEL